MPSADAGSKAVEAEQSCRRVGYVNELLTRLTNDPKYVNNDQTQVNHTLDSSPATFPLGKSFYADFRCLLLLLSLVVIAR